MMQQPLCRATKELVLRLIETVGAEHQTIDRVLPYELVNFDYWATCHHYSFIGHFGPELTLTEGVEALVGLRFQVLLELRKRCISVINPRKVRQVVHHVDHEQARLTGYGQTTRIIHYRG